MGGIIFHEKKATFTDGYKAWGDVTLPTNSVMLGSGTPTFVSYAMFGCHNNAGNFDAGIQVYGGGKYKLILNGGTALEPKSDGSTWYETSAFSASGTSTLTVELIYLTSTTGKVTISGFSKSLSANFGTGMWQNKFQNGVKFWKEMTIASSLTTFTDLWSSSNITNTQTVYMGDLTFKEVKLLRHSGGTTQYSLDSNSTTTTGTPKLDPYTSGSMPTWQQMRYGGTPTSGTTNLFSIDCRPL